ncbi:MAG TPA: DNRLRE domain-containing protein [Anaerolineae bacterium]|nr:DNRLRE domain-containing protein [Anaerolineae bacterium]
MKERSSHGVRPEDEIFSSPGFALHYTLSPHKFHRGAVLTIMMMKRLLTLLFIGSVMAFGVIAVAQAESPTVNQAVTRPAMELQSRDVRASWFLHPPTIDGDLSDWPIATKISLTGQNAAAPADSELLREEDLSGWLSVLWTSDRVYLAISVRDEYVVRESRNWMNDDMASIVFDVDQSGDYSVGDVLLTLSPDSLLTVNGGWPAGYEWASTIIDGGWQGEISIPRQEFGGVDFLGDVQVGFNWGLQDNDGIGVESWLSWAGPEYLRPTPDQGTLMFTDGPIRKWVAFHPGVDGYNGLVETTLSSWQPDTNYGNDAQFTIYSRNQFHTLMKFDIPDLGPDVRVLKGRVHIYAESRNHEWTSYVRIYRLLRPWDEGAATWFQADASTRWAVAGANSVGVDREGQAIGGGTLDRLGWFTFNLSSSAVQDMYANPDTNYGIIFRAEEGSSVRYVFTSSEGNGENAPWFEVYAEFPPNSD